jgi:hypothetical protein
LPREPGEASFTLEMLVVDAEQALAPTRILVWEVLIEV